MPETTRPYELAFAALNEATEDVSMGISAAAKEGGPTNDQRITQLEIDVRELKSMVGDTLSSVLTKMEDMSRDLEKLKGKTLEARIKKAINATMAGFHSIPGKMDIAGKKIGIAAETMKKAFEDFGKTLSENMTKMWEAFKNTKAGKKIAEAAKVVENSLKAIGGALKKLYKDTIGPKVNEIGGTVKGVFDKALEKIEPHMTAAKKKIIEAASTTKYKAEGLGIEARAGLGKTARKLGEALVKSGTRIEKGANTARTAHKNKKGKNGPAI